MKKQKQFIYSYTPQIEGVVTGILEGRHKALIEQELRTNIKQEYKGKERYNAMTSLEIVAL